VVATRIMGIPELVEEGKSGLLVPAGRADAIAQAIERLADDAPLRARMAAEGRSQVATAHDVRRSAARLRELFGQVGS